MMSGVDSQDGAGQTSFLRELLRQFRAQQEEAWDGKSDGEVLAPLLSRDLGDDPSTEEPDPEVFWRIEVFYTAIARTIEARTGVACSVMLRMHHEGFGRVVLLAGRLVVLDRTLRDVRRFGFGAVAKLAAAGERGAAVGAHLVERFPELARRAD